MRLRRWICGFSNWRFCALLLAALAIILRAPHLFTEPRFYCEEGLEYFVAPRLHGWPEWLYWPHQGYFSLIPNLACAAAWLVPLEMAPAVTTLVAFGVQLLPIAVLLWSESPLWSKGLSRSAAVLALLVSYGSGETWLSTIMSQYHLGVATALIFLDGDSAAGRARRWFLRAVLVVGGLTGVLSCFLLPLFGLRALRRRQRESFVHAGILAVCAVAQGIAAMSYGALPENIASATIASRIEIPSIVAVTAALSNNILLTNVLGELTAAQVVQNLATRPLPTALSPSLFAMLVFIPVASLLAFLGFERRTRPILGALAVVLLTTLAATMGEKTGVLVPGGGARYYLVPSSLFLLLLASCLANPSSRAGRLRQVLAALLLGCALIHGFIGYRSVVPDYREWSNWSEEVALFRDQPYRRLRIWPASLTMSLPPEPGTTAVTRIQGESRDRQGLTRTALTVSPPRLGSPLRVEIRGARGNAHGLLLIDEGLASKPEPVALIAGAFLYPVHGLQSPGVLPFLTDSTGTWVMDFPLADNRIFVGYAFTLQAVFGKPVDEVTNAIFLRLGR